MPDGKVVRCVEKVFAPGRLTRFIYRCAFASPFAYQTNRDAILACYYRRRVAAAILAASDTDVEIAEPYYIRFCHQSKAWVLAAKWVDGRGIRPLSANHSRFRSAIGSIDHSSEVAEIDQLVDSMNSTEELLIDSGLTGSGWQVAPRAMVSTANLLRVNERYTIIDLESGIPAILVPKYIVSALRCGTAPPFDDLDSKRLCAWLQDNEKLLTFRMGIDRAAQVASDVDQLVHHSQCWKAAEIAPLRRPWRLFHKSGLDAYQSATIANWQQNEIIDSDCAKELAPSSRKGRIIWLATLIPIVGRLIAKLIGRRQTRLNAKRWLASSLYRRMIWRQHLDRCQQQWSASDRILDSTELTTPRYLIHRALAVLPSPLHRFLSDRERRRRTYTTFTLLIFSRRYQSWIGHRHIGMAVDRWAAAKRISDTEANRLRNDLLGDEIRVYSRGFGMHVALKFLAPIVIPAKIGSVMAFIANGNGWFLLPLAATPVLRLAATIGNWFQSRGQAIRHREAMYASGLPFVGSIAFPLQMYATRPELAIFLIRDAASRIGCKLPIYGGSDSRTELACIRGTDFIIEVLDIASTMTGASETAGARIDNDVLTINRPKTRFGRWLDSQADLRIETDQIDQQPESDRPTVRRKVA